MLPEEAQNILQLPTSSALPPAARPASSPEDGSNSGGFYEEMMAEFNPNPTMGENAWTMATSESNKVSLIKEENVNRIVFW